jgi:hypothetical protein
METIEELEAELARYESAYRAGHWRFTDSRTLSAWTPDSFDVVSRFRQMKGKRARAEYEKALRRLVYGLRPALSSSF